MVRLELLNGARKDHERRVLREMEQRLIDLEITSETWRVAFDLARKARQRGLTVPATDIVIAACARHHGVGLEHADTHLASLEKIA